MPAVNNDDNVVDFNWANATDWFNFKAKITGETDNDGRIANVEITVPLKYLSNFWGTLEMPLINLKLNLFWHDQKTVSKFILMLQIKFLHSQ